ncbi:MAG: SpoIID/LytB domain-containing protein [Gemmatimonadaceae bacterium]
MRSLRRITAASARNWLAGGAAIGIAACMSVSSPGAGTGGNVPVVSGGYKKGSEQLVRIALVTSGPEGRVSGTGQWNLLEGPAETPSGSHDPNTEWTISAVASRLVPAPAGGTPGNAVDRIAVRSAEAGFVTWNGKRFRGDLVITATDSGLLVVNVLSMDSYLRGVVPLEIGNRTSAEMAAVQAQAVAARTYAYKHLNGSRAFDMYSTVQDQVYGGVDAEKPLSDSAIATTADIVVLYGGQPISTPYHSTCGGSTAAVTEVWYDQKDEPYLRPVSDKIPGSDKFYCDPSPRFSWTQNFDAAGLRAVMEKYLATYTQAPKGGVGRVRDVREQGRTQSGRLAALTVETDSGSYTLRGNDIRFVLRDPKGTILNSTFIDVVATKDGREVSALTVNGRGYGHGIGMCQWGAIGRARAGQSFRTILETYYPGTTIGRIAG